MTHETEALWTVPEGTRVFDLSHPMEPSMPVSPNHPGFRMALLRRHGDMVRADGGSAANEMLVLGGHSGTHLDGLAHVSQDGRLHGGVDAGEAQRGGRFSAHGMETVEPFYGRGILLDVARLRGVPRLPPGDPITGADLEAAARTEGVHAGAAIAILIRSGWAGLWRDPTSYLGHASGVPGPDVSAANWLASRGARVAGHDSMAFEQLLPGAGHSLLPVHRVLLVEHGIHIIENMNLEALAAEQVYEFLFVCLPLSFVGATASPVRPIAVGRR